MKIEDRIYSIPDSGKKSVPAPKPAPHLEPMALSKYNKLLSIVKYYKLKKELRIEKFSAVDETRLARATSRLRKAKSAAAPFLIQRLLHKLHSRGTGKKRGGVGSSFRKKSI